MDMAIIVILISTGIGIVTTLVIFVGVHLIPYKQMFGIRLQPRSADPHQQRLIMDVNQQSLISCMMTHVNMQD